MSWLPQTALNRETIGDVKRTNLIQIYDRFRPPLTLLIDPYMRETSLPCNADVVRVSISKDVPA